MRLSLGLGIGVLSATSVVVIFAPSLKFNDVRNSQYIGLI